MSDKKLHLIPVDDIMVHIADKCCECCPKPHETRPELLIHQSAKVLLLKGELLT